MESTVAVGGPLWVTIVVGLRPDAAGGDPLAGWAAPEDAPPQPEARAARSVPPIIVGSRLRRITSPSYRAQPGRTSRVAIDATAVYLLGEAAGLNPGYDPQQPDLTPLRLDAPPRRE
jgi:hypothetical protein